MLNNAYEASPFFNRFLHTHTYLSSCASPHTRSLAFSKVCVVAGLALSTVSAHAQVFLNLDGFGIGNGNCNVQTQSGPATDSANIHNMFYPQFGTETASVNVATRGTGYAMIASSSEFDSGIIRLQSNILAQGSSICEQNGGCGNGSATSNVTTRATFRVSEEAVLYLGGTISAASHVDPGIGGSGNSASTSNVVVTEGSTTLFGRTVGNSNGTLTSDTIPEGGVARLFPNTDYAFTVTSGGSGQAFGLNSSADGTAYTIVTVRLFPPACPTVTDPHDFYQCADQPSAPATFTVIASGALPRTVRWQRFDAGAWSDLVDGVVGGVGTVSGAATNMLTISAPGIMPNMFRNVVQNDCGTAFSNVATLHTNALCCDSVDFNNDTSLFDPQDIDAFLSVYSEGPCIPINATCNDIDFNNDGSLFDPCDIDAFLLVFSEGPCTPCGQ